MRRRRALIALAAAVGALGIALLIGLSCCGSLGPVLPYEAEIRPDAPPAFIIFGDTRRTLTAEFWRRRYDAERLQVIQALAAEAPAFVVNTGDLVCHGSDADEWRVFHQENQPVFSKKIPYYPCLGNHEFYGDNPRALRNYFTAFPALRGRRWYEIQFRSVLVAILDSNFDEMEKSEAEAQDRWFSDLLAAAERDTSVRHVLAVCHAPPYTNSRVHGDSKPVQERFVRRITPKVKAFVSGHVHAYERFPRDGVQFVVTGGGGAPLTSVDVERPDHADAFKGPAFRPFHYCRFTLEGPKLACDVLMLQDDRTWKRVDGFECP